MQDASFEKRLARSLKRLIREGSMPEQGFGGASVFPRELGLEVRNSRVLAPPCLELLEKRHIRRELSASAQAWLRELEVHTVIDSTNTRMMKLARSRSVEGRCWFAELQTAGRGRRGRHWFSPFAQNLAVSMGFAVDGAPKEAGALSLVVGLALADLIERLGVADVALKWPNDVLIGGAKCCGILIELVAHRRPLEAVIGIGLNLEVSAAARAVIDQEVADLR